MEFYHGQPAASQSRMLRDGLFIHFRFDHVQSERRGPFLYRDSSRFRRRSDASPALCFLHLGIADSHATTADVDGEPDSLQLFQLDNDLQERFRYCFTRFHG